MKLEDYFKIMDCVSEEDITEMMQTRRFRQIPSGKEDMMKQSGHQEKKALHMTHNIREILSGDENTMKESEKSEKKDFHMTRRGLASGTAVAAVLLALNIGFGGFMLHDPGSTTESRVNEVTEEITAETTIAASETEETVTTAASGAEKAVTAAAKQKTTTKQAAAKKTANTKTETVSGQTTTTQPASNETPTQQSTPAAVQQTPAGPAQRNTSQRTQVGPAQRAHTAQAQAETPHGGKLTYSLVPADRSYESGGTNVNAPVVFHAAAGEQIRMRLTIQNDPGVACFGVQYNMESFSLLTQTDLRYYSGGVSSIVFSGEQNRVLSIGGTGDGSTKAPDGAALAEFTLLAPSQPGRYVILEYTPDIALYDVNADGTETRLPDPYYVYADAEQTIPIDCDVLGAEIIVEESENISAYLPDPETMEGPTVYMEPVIAHAGQKNVAVNVYIRGCDPFASGYLRFGYDSALKSLLYDSDQVYHTDVTSDSRLGVGLDGTLLEHAMLFNSSTLYGNVINIFFNNYRNFGYNEDDELIVFRNGTTQEDAAITENGLLFTMYFDMPEECGHYQIFVSDGNLGGGASDEPGCLPNQTFESFIPCDITVIP